MNSNQLRNIHLNLIRRICLKSNYLVLTSNQIHHKLVNLENSNKQFLNRINLKSDLIQFSKRFKAKKTGSGKADDEDTDSEDEEEEESDSSEGESDEESGSSIKKIETINTRIDMILKNAIGGPKSRIDQWINEDKVRVNNERIVKKSDSVFEGDVIDIINGFVDEDADKLKITRCEFLHIDDKMNARKKFGSTIRITNDLEIDNYENAKYKTLI